MNLVFKRKVYDTLLDWKKQRHGTSALLVQGAHTIPTQNGKKYYETDFVMADGDKVSPIEVKSSGYNTHASLDAFCQKFKARIKNRYVIYTKDLKCEDGIDFVPVYMTMCL